MKKIFTLSITLGLLLMFSGCGSSADDPEAVMMEMADLLEGYIDDLGKCESADDVVNVMETYTGKFQKVKEKMEKLAETHPELKEFTPGKDIPEEYKKVGERFQEIMPKMMGVAGIMMKYGNDPKVQEAMRKFQEAMTIK